MLIDPSRDLQKYYDFADENNAEIIGVIETHPHADFISSHKLISLEKGAKVYVSELLGAEYEYEGFDNGDEIKMGQVVFESFNTPGHSPDSISILIKDNEGTQIAIFTGDTLFVGDVGRPDLREGVGNVMMSREELAEKLYHSIHDVIAEFKDEVIVYPAHGNGSLCGKNLSDEPSSTIGKEKKTNPGFLAKDKNEFVKYILEGQPYVPKYFPNSVQLNRKGVLSYKNRLTELANSENVSILKEDDMVIDI
ncbi:MAG: MBL fold metallo-hydrolase, partial [Candidatus Dojkabacteria bacterium]|nr:MBL fold metallo-hydrolase [Candidatus Dojkabacteria bacterium]